MAEYERWRCSLMQASANRLFKTPARRSGLPCGENRIANKVILPSDLRAPIVADRR